MMFLLGRHAMFGQDPPIYFRSMTAVRLPSLAIVQAINLPAVPLPSTTTSYFSAVFIRFISFRRLFAATNWSPRVAVSLGFSFRRSQQASSLPELLLSRSKNQANHQIRRRIHRTVINAVRPHLRAHPLHHETLCVRRNHTILFRTPE